MTGTRLMWTALAALVLVAAADAGIFTRKGKSDGRVKQLAETLRTDPDEKRRRAAVAELKDADPRTQSDVIPALVAALRRDPVAQVRADAAEAIGQFKLVFPVAGVALEAAAEADPAHLVRDTAQQALWEYHLNGYRSARGADGIAGQTPEPPVARPAVPRPVAAANTMPAPAVEPARAVTPALPPVTSVPTTSYKPTAPPAANPAAPRVIFTAAPPLQLNVSTEPPVAEPPVFEVAPAPRPAVGSLADAEPEPPPIVGPTPAGPSNLPTIPLPPPPTPPVGLPMIPVPPTR